MNSFVSVLKAEMVNYAGFNVYRHTKDPADRKRRTALLCTFAFLFVVAIGYIAGAAVALEEYGIGRAIPMLYPMLAMTITFMVGLLKARGNLYRVRDRELLSSLPVRSMPVAAARLTKMYVDGLIVTFIVLVPSFLVYGIAERAGAAFWLMIVPEILILPILPVALAAWVGIVFAAVIARVRHKVLAEVLLAVIAVVGLLTLSMVVTGGSAVNMDLSAITQDQDGNKLTQKEMNNRVAKQAAEALEKIEAKTPFVKTWGSWFSGAKPVGLLILAGVSLALLLITAFVIGRRLFAISGRLAPAAVHRDYKLTSLQSHSALGALVRKEAGRYFSSGLYVSNTIIGPVLAVVLAVVMAVFGPEELVRKMGNLPIAMHPTAALPFLLSVPFCMMTVTSSSISTEGKNWWIAKSLPLAAGDILNAKLLFNMLVFAPFYLVAELVLLFTVRVGMLQRLWLLLVPLVYIVFAIVFGLFLNLKFPKFKWENEAEVVKQSAAVALGILGVFAALLPTAGLLVLPGGFTHPVSAAIVVIVAAVTVLLYKKIRSTDLLRMGD
ncbi:MAG: hypothetical protein IKI15_09835 [Lachnospiraceae bacterium]|nr:hypothetical protein [Lachnospiraceae bacterium]